MQKARVKTKGGSLVIQLDEHCAVEMVGDGYGERQVIRVEMNGDKREAYILRDELEALEPQDEDDDEDAEDDDDTDDDE